MWEKWDIPLKEEKLLLSLIKERQHRSDDLPPLSSNTLNDIRYDQSEMHLNINQSSSQSKLQASVHNVEVSEKSLSLWITTIKA